MGKNLTLLAVGDIGIAGGDGHYPSIARPIPGIGARSAQLEKVKAVLQQGDFVLGNLEGVICETLAPSEGKSGTGAGLIRMAPLAADILKEAGFHLLVLANNHTMDYGNEGILQVLANLERVGIRPSGGGRNSDEARRPVILDRNGVKVAVLSYCSVFVPGLFPAGDDKPGIATVAVSTSYEIPGNVSYSPGAPPRIITTARREDKERMEKEVRQAKGLADVVVVNWHWGLTRYANAYGSGLPIEDSQCHILNYQEDMGRAAIDAGADLIIGHHPHRLQGMERYKGKLICYSLGILTMPFLMEANFGEESVIVKGYIDSKTKQLTKVTLIPVMVPAKSLEPYVVPIEKAGRIIVELEKQSRKYGVKFRVDGDEIAITE